MFLACQVENEQYLASQPNKPFEPNSTLSRLTLDQLTFGEDGCLPC